MKFLVCPASEEQLEYSDASEYFCSKNGVAYNYTIDFSYGDMISIVDTCGRYMPIDIEEIDGIAKMLTKIATYVKNRQITEDILIGELCYGAEV